MTLCLVAQRLAIDDPERTVGLVLETSFSTLRGREDLQEMVVTTMASLQDPIDPAFVSRFQRGTIVRPVPEPFLDAMVQESLEMPARVWREYPVGGHSPADPIHQRDIYRRWIAWIAERFEMPAASAP